MSSTGARVGTAIAGVVTTAVAALFSLGAAAIAVVGMCIGYVVMKRKGRRLTRGLSWVVAVGSVAAVALVLFALFALQAEAGTFNGVKQAMDSAAAKPPPPPPEWLKKITPPNVQRQNELTDKMMRSKAFTVWTMVVGGVFGVGFLATIAGSMGWVGGFLLLHSATGTWLPRATLEDYRD